MIESTEPLLLSPAPSRRRVLQGLAALVASGWVPAGMAQDPLAPLSAQRFAAVSRTTTGFVFDDPETATAMLRALNDAVGASTLARIANLAAVIGPDQLSSELKIAGLDGAAAKVVTALYTGVVDGPSGQVVLTYNNALVWQACAWTKPNMLCGGVTNYWSEPPAGLK